MWISKQKFNAELNKAYLEAYEKGREHGRLEDMLSIYSINDIRKMLGLEPIKEKGEDDD